MNLGQTYKIKYTDYYTASDIGVVEQRKAKLIFEGKHFYTFEYKSKTGDLLRVTLDKRDNNVIQEV